MNHIETLIQKHCPNGVEFKALQEICNLRAGDRIIKSMMNVKEKYPVMGGGVVPTGYYKGYNFSKGVTIARAGSAGFVSWQENPFWATDVCFVATLPQYCHTERSEVSKSKSADLQNHLDSSVASLPQNDKIMIRFIYYAMKCIKYSTMEHSRQWIEKYSKLQIPIPPLAIQYEIVKILDSFTELEKELEKELEARRKQYEYYREKLLSFESLVRRAGGGQFVKMMKLGEIGTFVRGNGLQKKDFVESGVPCIHYGQIYTHYGTFTHETKSFVSEEVARKLKKAQKGNLIVAGVSENKEDVCKAVVYLGNDEICISGDSFAFAHSQNPKFIGYFFQTDNFNKQKTRYITGTKVMRVHINSLKTFQIPIPPLKVQNEVVDILDRFDKLTNDISEGIPAEIVARKKQYEYYREQLLTFKEAK